MTKGNNDLLDNDTFFLKGYLLGVNAPPEIMDILNKIIRVKESNTFQFRNYDGIRLSVRAMNALERDNINTWEDLEDKTISEMLKVPDCGKVTVREIQKEMHRHGKKFRHCYLATTEGWKIP